MGSYSLYRSPPDSPEGRDHFEIVSEGFCLWAFLFDGIWLAVNRLWWPAIAVGYAWLAVIVGFVTGYIDAASALILAVGVKTLVGYMARDWYRTMLEQASFEEVAVLWSRDAAEAWSTVSENKRRTVSDAWRSPFL